MKADALGPTNCIYNKDLSSKWPRGTQMGVSKNRGTPKSSILIGISLINHPFWGGSIFGNTQITKRKNSQTLLSIYVLCTVCHCMSCILHILSTPIVSQWLWTSSLQKNCPTSMIKGVDLGSKHSGGYSPQKKSKIYGIYAHSLHWYLWENQFICSKY